jgi:carboxymethylenebutenolidase
MEPKTAHDFDQELLTLFDAYVHGMIGRRTFLDRAAKYAAGGLAAAILLDQLNPKFAEARVVNPDDKRLEAKYIEYNSPKGYGKLRGYLVRPKGPIRSTGSNSTSSGKLPGILVIHENRGLNPHIEDIARRIALDNFIAFAPDALSPLGGYPGDEDKARTLFQQLSQDKSRADFIAAADFLRSHPNCQGKIGAVGFCWGGGMVNYLATQLVTPPASLAAGVAFYGSAPNTEDVAKIKSPLLVHAAENDDRINKSWPEFEGALKAAKANYQYFLYPGTQHGFNNDTTPRYDAAAAKLAWQRTIAFFKRYLRT